MRKYLIPIFLFSICFGCKKSDQPSGSAPAPTPVTPTPVSKYLIADTTVQFYTGLKQSPTDQIKKIPLIDKYDTTIIPVHGRLRTGTVSFEAARLQHELASFPDVLDQSPNNNCVGYALGYALMSYVYRNLEKDQKLTLSPSFIWNQLNDGKNEGIFLTDAIQLVQQKGTSRLSLMPASVAFTKKPEDPELDDALNYTISDYYRFGEPNVHLMKAMLRRNLPIVFGAVIDKTFKYPHADYWSVLADGKYVWNKRDKDESGSGHAMTVIGYDDGIQAFKIQNSWGTTKWIKDGIAWISYELFKEIVLAYNSEAPELYIAVPRIATVKEPLAITESSATANGEIHNTGFFNPSLRGFCYSESKHPTIANKIVEEKKGLGSYSLNLKGLKGNTKYYIRAFASEGQRTLYSNEIEFKTTPATPPQVSTTIPSSITATTASIGGIIIKDGGVDVLDKGIIYSLDQGFTNSTTKSAGEGNATYTINVMGLAPAKNYYVKAYATNIAGTGYGNEIKFATMELKEPVVTTNPVTSVTHSTAESGGVITDDGGSPVITRGVCWSTSDNPTISNSNNRTIDDEGIGSFNSSVSGLEADKTYYLRAYATNSRGTGYGNSIEFKTKQNNENLNLKGNYIFDLENPTGDYTRIWPFSMVLNTTGAQTRGTINIETHSNNPISGSLPPNMVLTSEYDSGTPVSPGIAFRAAKWRFEGTLTGKTFSGIVTLNTTNQQLDQNGNVITQVGVLKGHFTTTIQ